MIVVVMTLQHDEFTADSTDFQFENESIVSEFLSRPFAETGRCGGGAVVVAVPAFSQID